MTDNEKQSPEDALAALTERCHNGLQECYGLTPDVDSPVTERLRVELQAIAERNCQDAFLAAADVVNYTNTRNIALGPGHGTLPSSLAAYLLHISEIDPIAHELLFDCFLNPVRAWRPRLQMDVCYLKAGEIDEWLADTHPDAADDISVLGIGRVTIIHRTCELAVQRGAPLLQGDIPMADEPTLALMNTGKGRELWPLQDHIIQAMLENSCSFRSFDDVVALKALDPFMAVHPDTVEEIEPQVEAEDTLSRVLAYFRGEVDKELAANPLLNGQLADTHGILLFQDQQIRIIAAAANVPFGVAEQMLYESLFGSDDSVADALKAKFITAAAENSTAVAAESLWDLVTGRFCLSKGFAHALALIEYRIAFLQTHYPEEFETASTEFSILYTE